MPILSTNRFLQNLSHQPDWYFWDFQDGEAIFVNMDAQSYRESVFTDRRIVLASSQKVTLHEAKLYATIPVDVHQSPPRKVNYIFHMAHCGSTLLARSFDFLGTTLVYREPRVLRKLGCSRHITDFSLFQSRLDCSCTLLTRTFDKTQIPIVKANVPVNFILPDIINSPAHNLTGVLLYQNLDIYLLNLYNKPSQRHQWINQVVEELAAPISQITNLPIPQILISSIEKKLVLLWFAQMKYYQEALLSSAKMLPLNAEEYFANPLFHLMKVANHFEMNLSHEQILEIVNSQLYKSYSKSKERLPYNNELRLQLQQRLQKKHHKQIDSILDWAYQTLDNLPTLTYD